MAAWLTQKMLMSLLPQPLRCSPAVRPAHPKLSVAGSIALCYLVGEAMRLSFGKALLQVVRVKDIVV
jgi:hypothetical protein